MKLAAEGPPKRRFLGHLPEFLKDRIGFLTRCAEQYGEVVKLKIGGLTYLLTNPDDIRHVLVTNASNYEKSPRLHGPRAKRLLGEGLLTSTGDAHLKRRRMLQPIFTKKGIEAFVEEMSVDIQEATSSWKAGEAFDIAARMLDLTQRVMIVALFGDDGRKHMPVLQRAASIRRRYYEHMLGSPFPRPDLHPVRAVREYRVAIKQLDALILRAIERRRTSPGATADLLTGFVHSRDEDGNTLTTDQIRTEALSFMDTGYTTIAAALTWAWYLLGQNPDAQSRMQTEVDAVLHGRPPRGPDLIHLSYTRMVLAEAMRIYPPTWMFVRTTLAADTLPSGTTLPAGAMLYLCQYIAHRNPRYFPDPGQFDPLRHDENAPPARPKFAYFPFGGGAHLCIGEHFANAEGALALAGISQRFQIELIPAQTVELDPGLALLPKGPIRVRLIARNMKDQ